VPNTWNFGLELRIYKLKNARPAKLNDIYHYQAEAEEIKHFLVRLSGESRECISSIKIDKATKSETQKLSVLSKQQFEQLYRDISSEYLIRTFSP